MAPPDKNCVAFFGVVLTARYRSPKFSPLIPLKLSEKGSILQTDQQIEMFVGIKHQLGTAEASLLPILFGPVRDISHNLRNSKPTGPFTVVREVRCPTLTRYSR